MQDMLVPIFGENGAIIVQYVITLAVVLALIVLVVWAIRRFGGGAVSPAARGRLPRLAVVDTLAIDNKRRLVLVRRDSVEHLVLIGGPTDVVVEPSIVRQRVAQRPGQATAGQATAAGRVTPAAVTAAPPPPPPPAPPARATMPAAPRTPPPRSAATAAEAVEEAIPFQPRRTPFRASERIGLSRREPTRNAMTAAVAPASDPLIEPTTSRRQPLAAKPAFELEVFEEQQAAEIFADEPPSAEPPDGPVPGYAETQDDQDTVSAFAPPSSERTIAASGPLSDDGPGASYEPPSAPPTADAEPPDGAVQAAEVSDLEKEMARLLDQISTTRRD